MIKLNDNENLILLYFIILVLLVVINVKLSQSKKPKIISFNKFSDSFNIVSEEDNIEIAGKNKININVNDSDGAINIYGPTIY